MAHFALTSCSNPTLPWAQDKLPKLVQALEAAGHILDTSAVEALARESAQTPDRWDPRERARILERAFAAPDVDAILDISGGDLANEILPHLDFEAVSAHPKLMVGYSDMSCVLGALPFPTLLWNPLVGITEGFEELDQALARDVVRPELVPVAPSKRGAAETSHLTGLPWAGGNIRCFLKLAGTPWRPDLTGRVLLLEGQGPSLTAVAALLGHHEALGSFERAAGVVVGQFTKIDEAGQRGQLLDLVREYARGPLAEAPSVGHSLTSGAVTLG